MKGAESLGVNSFPPLPQSCSLGCLGVVDPRFGAGEAAGSQASSSAARQHRRWQQEGDAEGDLGTGEEQQLLRSGVC